MKYVLLLVVGILFILSVLGIIRTKALSRDYLNPKENLKITSSSFQNGAMIPVKYTGYGKDLSPQISIYAINPKAKTIAIIMDDEDHPIGTYNHWLIWNIPASYNEIPEGIPKTEVVPELGNAIQGKSCYGGKHYYRGPKPPFGTHRYTFKVYVLDIVLDLHKDTRKAGLQKAMNGHILQFGILEGKYSK